MRSDQDSRFSRLAMAVDEIGSHRPQGGRASNSSRSGRGYPLVRAARMAWLDMPQIRARLGATVMNQRPGWSHQRRQLGGAEQRFLGGIWLRETRALKHDPWWLSLVGQSRTATTMLVPSELPWPRSLAGQSGLLCQSLPSHTTPASSRRICSRCASRTRDGYSRTRSLSMSQCARMPHCTLAMRRAAYSDQASA